MEKREKRWMKIKEAAEYLSASPDTIYRMLWSHQIPGVKIKRVGWRIDRKKLDDTLEKEIEENGRRWTKIFDWR